LKLVEANDADLAVIDASFFTGGVAKVLPMSQPSPGFVAR
jgi:hypothetical protein